MKLPNGYGSISKMKGNLRNPYRVYAPYDFKTNIRKTLGYVKSKTEGMALLAEFHKNKNLFLDKPTLENIYDLFMPSKNDKSADTLAMYKTSWNYFDDIKDEYVSDLKSHHIQDIIDSLIDDGMSYSTVHKVKTLANQLFKTALKDDYVSKNYAEFVRLPKKPTPDNRTFTDDEIDKLLNCAKSNYWASIMVCMIFTCTRPGEFLKIEKKNVNIKEKYLITGSKTEAGRDRFIPINNKILHLIEDMYKTSNNNYLVSFNNKKINYRYYLDKHYEVIDSLGLQKLSPHKCRKTGATYYQKRGMDRLSLQKIMGHKDYKTTDQFYTGDVSDMLKESMESV